MYGVHRCATEETEKEKLWDVFSDARGEVDGRGDGVIHTGSYGSTTIDHICEKAGVKKGSFYYFFDSKSDLAIAAVEARFPRGSQTIRRDFFACDSTAGTYSRNVPVSPRTTERTSEEARTSAWLSAAFYRLRGKHGRAGTLCQIQEIMVHHRKYLESTIREAHTQGLIHAPDPVAKAEMVFAYYEGLADTCRIQNDLSVLSEMEVGIPCRCWGSRRQLQPEEIRNSEIKRVMKNSLSTSRKLSGPLPWAPHHRLSWRPTGRHIETNACFKNP